MPHVRRSRTFSSNSNILSRTFFAVLKVMRMISPPTMRFNFLHAPSNIFTLLIATLASNARCSMTLNQL
jgi:hypothetical protein